MTPIAQDVADLSLQGVLIGAPLSAPDLVQPDLVQHDDDIIHDSQIACSCAQNGLPGSRGIIATRDKNFGKPCCKLHVSQTPIHY